MLKNTFRHPLSCGQEGRQRRTLCLDTHERAVHENSGTFPFLCGRFFGNPENTEVFEKGPCR